MIFNFLIALLDMFTFLFKSPAQREREVIAGKEIGFLSLLEIIITVCNHLHLSFQYRRSLRKNYTF